MTRANATPGLRRAEIRKIFDRNKGSKLRLSQELGCSHSAVSLVLTGRSKSARILAAAEKVAMSLLSAESKAKA